jgi:hypothetical protein
MAITFGVLRLLGSLVLDLIALLIFIAAEGEAEYVET